MTSAKQVLAGRAERNAARHRLDAQLAKLKADYEERGLGGRIADELSVKAGHAIDEAAQVASESKGIIAGTIGLLAIWFLRNPIISVLDRVLSNDADEEGYNTDDYE